MVRAFQQLGFIYLADTGPHTEMTHFAALPKSLSCTGKWKPETFLILSTCCCASNWQPCNAQSVKKCWQQHELMSCTPQEDHVYSIVMNAGETRRGFEGSPTFCWNPLLTVTAVSQHIVLAELSQCCFWQITCLLTTGSRKNRQSLSR